jgi:hypothetical protein
VANLVRIKLTLILISLLYLASWIAFLVVVSARISYLRGYFRPDLVPGPFTDHRYGPDWFFFLLNNFRLLLPIGTVWVLINQKIQFNTDTLIYFTKILVVFDLVCFIYLLIIWCFFCNTENGYIEHLCTAPLEDYCRGFWPTHPDICAPSIDPPIGKIATSARKEFIIWLVYTLVYYFVDFLIFLPYLRSFKFYVRKKIENDLYTDGVPIYF